MAMQPKEAKEMTDEGWTFQYEPATRYVSLCHPKGGLQSVLHFPSRERGKQFGEAVADMLNGK